MSIWYQEVAEIGARANAWCNFALVCGILGFVLSVVAAVMLLKIIKEENNGN